MPFSIVRNDISRMGADVLVNAANERLAPGGGVCGALYAAAGFDRMLEACRAIGGCPTGGAVTTPGFDLPCRWVVHAVGPVWGGGGHGEEALLRRCYQSVFAEVERLGAESVAFPLISAGIYGYPVAEALEVAREVRVQVTVDRAGERRHRRVGGLQAGARRGRDGRTVQQLRQPREVAVTSPT